MAIASNILDEELVPKKNYFCQFKSSYSQQGKCKKNYCSLYFG